MNDALVIEVVRKTVTVDCAVEEAFRIFTADAHELVAGRGPLDPRGREARSCSSRERAARCTRSSDAASADTGRRSSSGSRRADSCSRGRSLRASWAPRSRCASCPRTRHTRVELEHRGWERVAAGAADKRDSYDTGWESRPREVRRPRLDASASRPEAPRRAVSQRHEPAKPLAPTGRRRSPARSTAGRRAASRRGCAPGARARAARGTRPGRRPCRRTRCMRGSKSRAIASSRSRAPCEVGRPEIARAARRSAGGVRQPDAEGEQLRCSCGSNRRGVNPAAWSSRQKSFRGLAKAAPAAALA